MIQGKLIKDDSNFGERSACGVKETVITVKATKMDIEQ
jgi:hypothetical protein